MRDTRAFGLAAFFKISSRTFSQSHVLVFTTHMLALFFSLSYSLCVAATAERSASSRSREKARAYTRAASEHLSAGTHTLSRATAFLRRIVAVVVGSGDGIIVDIVVVRQHTSFCARLRRSVRSVRR